MRDTTPARVVGVSPAPNDSLVGALPTIRVWFSEPIAHGTVMVKQGAQAETTAGVVGPAGTLTFKLALPLEYEATTDLTLTDAADTVGNITPPYAWTVRTKAFAWPLGMVIATPIPTYDGSGAALHPSVLYFPDGWRGWEWVMAYTPYPNLNAAYENPSIAVSHDGLVWITPPGLHNPILLPGPGPASGEPGYPQYTGRSQYHVLSDVDLTYDTTTDRLRVCSREVGAVSGVDGIMGEWLQCQYATDFLHWSPSEVVAQGDGGSRISPTYIFGTGGWTAWTVQGKCGDSITTVTRIGSDGSTVLTDLQQPGYTIWHIQVRQFAGAYWALYNAYRFDRNNYGCTPGDLFLARSADGDHWRVSAQAVLQHGLVGADFSSGFYRSSLVYDPATGILNLFLSGYVPYAIYSLTTEVGAVRYDLAQLLASLGL